MCIHVALGAHDLIAGRLEGPFETQAAVGPSDHSRPAWSPAWSEQGRGPGDVGARGQCFQLDASAL